jgi:uncharacterized protein (DUF362 family)/ferredoxin
MDNQVYVVRCPDYGQVEEKLAKLLAKMGSISRFAAPGERIVLKANLLMATEPDRAVTTHPAVVAAVGRMTKNVGAAPIVVDSPGSGYPYTEATLRRVYRACGMDAAAQEAGIELNFDITSQSVSFLDGALTKHLDIITPLVEADGVFNLCKLKTHTYMGMTGAVKNSFGAIPGLAKPGYHAKLHDPTLFAQMLIDLSSYVAPRLSIMDAVVGMEGDGPNNGTPYPFGLLLAATNPLALDVVAGEILGLPRQHNPILLAAEKQGRGPTRLAEIDLIGMDVADLRVPNLKLPVTGRGMGLQNTNWWQRALSPLFRDALNVKPQVIEKQCIACGACRDACPMHAISIIRNNGTRYARIDRSDCIRCYCCHEMCPHDAIELQPSRLYRLMNS